MDCTSARVKRTFADMYNPTHCPIGGNGSEAVPDIVREARDLKHGSDCPWLTSDPQLLAAAAADRAPEKQHEALELTADEAAELKRIEDEMLQLVRRG
jgi:hypothetical protein